MLPSVNIPNGYQILQISIVWGTRFKVSQLLVNDDVTSK